MDRNRTAVLLAVILLCAGVGAPAGAQPTPACRVPGGPPILALIHGGQLLLGGVADPPAAVDATWVDALAWSPGGVLAHTDLRPTEPPADVVVVRGPDGARILDLPSAALSLDWFDDTALLVPGADALRRLDTTTGLMIELTGPPEGATITGASLSPDHQRIAFSVQRTGLSPELWVLDAVGARQWAATALVSVGLANPGSAEVLTDLGPDHAPVGIAVDDVGEHLVLTVDSQHSETLSDFWVAPLSDPAAAVALDVGLELGHGSAALAPTCPDRLARAAGETRIETAAAISAATWVAAATAVLTRADRPLDALLAGPLTGGAAPLLLTTSGTALHPATRAELVRVSVDRVVVVGDVGAPAVADLAGMGVEVDVIAGADPYALAAAVADRLDPDRILLVRGEPEGDAGWPDAVSAAAWASRDGFAVLPTPADRLHPTTADAISELGVPVTLIGGPAAIGDAVQDEVAALGVEVRRVGGRTRLETSAAVADASHVGSTGDVWLTTAANWPDTLAVAPAAASTGAVSLLVDPLAVVGTPTGEWLRRRAFPDVQVRLAGGPDVLPWVIGLQALELVADG